MPPWDKVTSVWKNVQEVDLRPIRREAERRTTLALIGQAGSGRQALADLLRVDPSRPEAPITAPVRLLDLDDQAPAAGADLALVLVQADQEDVSAEQRTVNRWIAAGKPVLVIINRPPSPGDKAIASWMDWGTAQVIQGACDNPDFLLDTLAPAIIGLLPGRQLSLGRNFPLLRLPIALQLINDTCFSNAVYSFSTGLAEIVPVLDIPLNIADILVLTKAQALMVYRLGLLLGLSTEWQYYLGELGSVIGSGFLWRQAARQLVGLIPVWGIIPKVAVAYAGTYVVGHAMLRWYQTGRHLTRKEIGALYRQAFDRGKKIAGNLRSRIPRPRLRRSKPAALPATTGGRPCPTCQTLNDDDAKFCKTCGSSLAVVDAGD